MSAMSRRYMTNQGQSSCLSVLRGAWLSQNRIIILFQWRCWQGWFRWGTGVERAASAGGVGLGGYTVAETHFGYGPFVLP